MNQREALRDGNWAPRIVIVNDEPNVLGAFEVIIRGCLPDALVWKFRAGSDALQEVRKKAPDLFITGDRMSRMSGEKVCRILLARKAAFPIIVKTAWARSGDWVRTLTSKGLKLSCLALPCTTTELWRLIQYHLKLPGETRGGGAFMRVSQSEPVIPVSRLVDSPQLRDMRLTLQGCFSFSLVIEIGRHAAGWLVSQSGCHSRGG